MSVRDSKWTPAASLALAILIPGIGFALARERTLATLEQRVANLERHVETTARNQDATLATIVNKLDDVRTKVDVLVGWQQAEQARRN